jgi:alpha-methylacyl-CoA racemase
LTRLLADLGASVIKVEAPEGGDPLRDVPPAVHGCGAAFAALNYGKQSLALDLARPAGAALLLELAAHADILVESFRPGVLARWGLDYESLQRRNPRLIVCSITGYGQTGPLRSRPGHDLNYLARDGLLDLMQPRAPEGLPGLQLADVVGGSQSAALAVLAALLERTQTGRGCHLDIAMARSAVSLAAFELARSRAGGAAPHPESLLGGALPCYRVYRTQDGRAMALAALEPKFFEAFCRRAGCPELIGLGLAAGPEGERVKATLVELFSRRTQAEWTALLEGAECCCEPVRTLDEALADAELGLVTDEVGGAVALATDVGAGPSFAVERRVPELGADGAAVLRHFAVPQALTEAALRAGALRLPSGSTLG